MPPFLKAARVIARVGLPPEAVKSTAVAKQQIINRENTMIKPIIKYMAFPALALVLLVSVPSVQAAGTPDMAKSVTEPDHNPALSRAVKMDLGKVSYLDTPDIQVVSNEGTVTIMGNVASGVERAEAERIARDTNGVSRVINDLRVNDSVMEVDYDGK